jgi:hypothetical protein
LEFGPFERAKVRSHRGVPSITYPISHIQIIFEIWAIVFHVEDKDKLKRRKIDYYLLLNLQSEILKCYVSSALLAA